MKNFGIGLMVTLLFVAGCASYSPGTFPVGNLANNINVAENNGISIYINIPDFPTTDIFSCDLNAIDIFPIYISISNNGNNHYSFSKRNLNYQFESAEQVGKLCGIDVIANGGIFPPTIIRAKKINESIIKDYMSKEFPEEVNIAPGGNVNGIIYLRNNGNFNKVEIDLFNMSSGSKLPLTVDVKNALTKSNLYASVGDKYYTQTNLHLSDGDSVYTDNYLNGKLIPLGTKITVTGLDGGIVSLKADDGTAYNLKRGKKEIQSILFEMAPEKYLGKSNPQASDMYKRLSDSEKIIIKTGIAKIGMSKELVAYTLGYPVAQESPYLGFKWSYWRSEDKPLHVFFDAKEEVFKIHEGYLVGNQEYAYFLERQLRTYVGANKSRIVIEFGPPERTMPDGAGGEIFVYENLMPIKSVGSSVSSSQFVYHYRNFASSSSLTTVEAGYKESMRASIYANQDGMVYLVRCNTTVQEGGSYKYNKD